MTDTPTPSVPLADQLDATATKLGAGPVKTRHASAALIRQLVEALALADDHFADEPDPADGGCSEIAETRRQIKAALQLAQGDQS